MVNVEFIVKGKRVKPLRGWISPEGEVFDISMYEDHFSPEALIAIGFDPSKPKRQNPLNKGWVRFMSGEVWGASPETYFIEGYGIALENVKSDILSKLQPKRLEVVVIDSVGLGQEYQHFSAEEFEERDWNPFGTSKLPDFRGKDFTYRGKQGKGWWEERPRHQIAARLGRIRRHG